MICMSKIMNGKSEYPNCQESRVSFRTEGLFQPQADLFPFLHPGSRNQGNKLTIVLLRFIGIKPCPVGA